MYSKQGEFVCMYDVLVEIGEGEKGLKPATNMRKES